MTKIHFLPYVRQGFRPGPDGHSSVPWRAQARVQTRLGSGGQAHPATTRFDLLGPGDVIGIAPSEVLRVLPARNSPRAEPEFFPAVEFDSPELPWMFSPLLPGRDRLMPWIRLIVVELQEGVSLSAGSRGQSPWILHIDPELVPKELPRADDAWAFAHAQVTCERQEDIRGTLERHADRTLSRLIAPRRLLAHKRYAACVVPTFAAGREAGLGNDPEANAATLARNLAWGGSEPVTELPVYFTWQFTTGESGDVESMVRALKPLAASSLKARPLRARVSGVDDAIVDFQPALRAHMTSPREERPAATSAAIRAALEPAAGQLPVFGPPLLGASWTGRPNLDAEGWATTLNLTPMWRAAAGLGAELVRREQEAMTVVAARQLEAERAAQRTANARALSELVHNRIRDRLHQAPDEEATRVLGPVVTREQPAADSVGLLTSAGRRTTARAWRTEGGANALRAKSTAKLKAAAAPAMVSALAAVSATTSTKSASGSVSTPEVQAPPTVDKQRHLAPELVAVDNNRFEPRFGTPLAETFAQHFGDLMLPGVGDVPPDSVLGLEANAAFIEAFLVGANEELNRELLWRGFPVARGAVGLRRFLQHAQPRDDIGSPADWPATRALGQNAAPMGGGILLRSELIARCPGLTIGVVRGYWEHGSRKFNRADVPIQPVTRTRVGEDMLFLGFGGLSLATLVGGRTPDQPAGYYFVFAESPLDPRFGVDPPATPLPELKRDTLSWSHLGRSAAASYASASDFPAVTDARFDQSDATAASFAHLLQQRPFRAYLHAGAVAVRES
jgi:hypothetical protein